MQREEMCLDVGSTFSVAAVGITLPLSAIEHQGHRSKFPKSTPHNGSCFVNCMGLSLWQDHGRRAPLVPTLLINCSPLQATRRSISGKFKSCTAPLEIGLISEEMSNHMKRNIKQTNAILVTSKRNALSRKCVDHGQILGPLYCPSLPVLMLTPQHCFSTLFQFESSLHLSCKPQPVKISRDTQVKGEPNLAALSFLLIGALRAGKPMKASS